MSEYVQFRYTFLQHTDNLYLCVCMYLFLSVFMYALFVKMQICLLCLNGVWAVKTVIINV